MGLVDAAANLALLLLSAAGLWGGATLFIDAAIRLARAAGLSELVIGLTVVALGTSAPEVAVTVDAAASGLGDVAVANVVGSSIFNLTAILGFAALVRAIPIDRSLVRRDGVALLASTLLGALLLSDLRLTRLDGLILLASLLVYLGYLYYVEASRLPRRVRAASPVEDTGPATAETTEASGGADAEPVVRFGPRDALALLGGIGLVVVSGDVLVDSATTLAQSAGISEWVIGATIVAAGTSTPEFAVSVAAVRRGSVGVSVGNVVGSNIVNVLGVLGVAAALHPLSFQPVAVESLAWLVAVVAVLVAALWSGRRLSRAEGGLFVLSELVRWAVNLFG